MNINRLSRCLLVPVVFLLCAGASPARINLQAPFPVHTEENPLRVTSPVTVSWKSSHALAVEITRDRKRVLPSPGSMPAIVSGSEFQLDPGLYKIKIHNGTGDAYLNIEAGYLSIWVEVLPARSVFNLRTADPGTRGDVRAVKKDLNLNIRQVEAVQQDVTHVSKQVHAAETKICEVLDKFSIRVPAGNPCETEKERTISHPLQWLADRMTRIETRLHDLEKELAAQRESDPRPED